MVHVAGIPPPDVGNIGEGGPAAEAALNNAEDVAVAPNGDIYIADRNSARLLRIRDGVLTVAYRGDFAAGENDFSGVAISADGTVYFTTGLAVKSLSLDGTVTDVLTVEDSFQTFGPKLAVAAGWLSRRCRRAPAAHCSRSKRTGPPPPSPVPRNWLPRRHRATAGRPPTRDSPASPTWPSTPRVSSTLPTRDSVWCAASVPMVTSPRCSVPGPSRSNRLSTGPPPPMSSTDRRRSASQSTARTASTSSPDSAERSTSSREGRSPQWWAVG